MEEDPGAARALADICVKVNDLEGADAYRKKAAELDALKEKERKGREDKTE